MSGRKDIHLDAMLRHLGAAYYDALHHRAAQSDVTRAAAEVASHLGEKSAEPAAPKRPAGQRQHTAPKYHGRWRSRVRDIMTTSVVSVDRITPYKDIANLLVAHQISGVPVLTMGRHVAGVVSEADLLAARDRYAGTRRRWTGLPRYQGDRGRHLRLTAEQLMSSPPVTINPDATLAAAGRLMAEHHVKRLPVTDPDGKLLGLVSRRDVLGVFLIPDAEIERQVRELFAEVAPAEPVAVQVENGIVTLIGHSSGAALRGPVRAAIDLTWDIDGVVDIIDHTANGQHVPRRAAGRFLVGQ